MRYLFLTGGTGLLGNYLVRDLLNAGVHLALLVRSTKKESARQRVESLIARWEEECQKTLPRPVVIEGDLTEERLGLDAQAVEWIARNCSSVMHNAASLTFNATTPDDEPWRSNLHGTRRVLDLCREAKIRNFHHVSTAYVCGQRMGRIYESELDMGQTHSNDYELSKFRAELMVRDADFLDTKTVYRPSIILGDSETGYTSTFWGYYAPLKLLSSLLSKAAGVATTREELAMITSTVGKRLESMLNFTGQERKNYVPVDWCSEVATHIYVHPEHHGKTYHLTPDEPVSLSLTRRVTQEAFTMYGELADERTHNEKEWANFEKFFVEGMRVYESYWRDDPIFDTTNTHRAAPHLPCPVMDADFFMLMCRYAIESNFGRKAGRGPGKPKLDVQEKLRRWMAPENRSNTRRHPSYVGLRVDGPGGGQWELAVCDGHILAIEQGLTDRCGTTLQLTSQIFGALASEKLAPRDALDAGQIRISGDKECVCQAIDVLHEVARGKPAMQHQLH